MPKLSKQQNTKINKLVTKQIAVMLLIVMAIWTILLLTNPQAQQNINNARLYKLMQNY